MQNVDASFQNVLKKSRAYGKIVGRAAGDNQVRWRTDWDPIKGPHIHIEDFRTGEKLFADNIVIPFEGDEETFLSLIRHLNK